MDIRGGKGVPQKYLKCVDIDTNEISYLILVTEVPTQELEMLQPLLYSCVCKSNATVVIWCKYQLSGGST